jgi:hypothetical protein
MSGALNSGALKSGTLISGALKSDREGRSNCNKCQHSEKRSQRT